MPRVEFGADGIRGIAGEWPFVPAIAVRIGQALGQFVRDKVEHPVVVIGRDTRPSGAELLSCLVAGLTGQGADVIDLGVMTTPGVAFLVRRLQADLGVIVSASHSPLECNGIKVLRQNGLRLQREEEIEIESLINDFAARAVEYASPLGQQSDGRNLIELYIQDHVKRCPAESLEGIRVVLDCADGAASRVAPEAFRRLGAEITVVNDAIDRKSINHRCGSEYAREHPQDLVRVMKQHEAEYGFAFDGDGDRLVVVDEEGRVFDGHDILFILAMYFHSKGLLRSDAVVTIHQANRGLEEALHRAFIRTIYTSNGDRNLEAEMWGGGYLLGGEPGGNIIINDGHHTAADAVYAALVLSGVLVCNRGVALGEMASPLRKRPQVTISLDLPIMLTLNQKSTLQEQIRPKEVDLGEDGRILVWDSSTEPGVFRVMVEGSPGTIPEEVSQTADSVCQLIRRAANAQARIAITPYSTASQKT
ncbi:MAG: phosphoglucosamine mutase [Chloroflexota bacterium]|nr:phosphoglucosamine mutase [Anaerolineae bacterium]